MRLVVLVSTSLSLSACGYRAGSFHTGNGAFEGKRATVGCLDVAVAPHADRAAKGPAAAFTIGNRCDWPVRLDLRLPVVLRTAQGDELPTRAYDPNREIRPLLLDGRQVATEYIEYQCPALKVATSSACFDVSAIDGADRKSSKLLCIDARCSAGAATKVVRR